MLVYTNGLLSRKVKKRNSRQIDNWFSNITSKKYDPYKIRIFIIILVSSVQDKQRSLECILQVPRND